MLEIGFESKVFEDETRKIDDAFQEACDWMKSLNVFPASNRYTEYQRQFRDLREGNGESIRADGGLKFFSNALGEATELIRIKNSFVGIDSQDYLVQLGKISSGRPFKDFVSHDPGRDFAFELSIASRFISAGYEINLGTIADAVVNIANRKLFVECKRVQSEKKIGARLKEASEQVGRRVTASRSSKSRGLVAVKITEIINPDSQNIVLENPQDFIDFSKDDLHSYIRENEIDFRRHISSKQLGVFFENSLNGLVRSADGLNIAPAFIACRGAAVLCRSKLGFEDMSLLQEFGNKLTTEMNIK